METYVYFLIAFYFTAMIKSSIKETNKCLIQKENLKHELSNLKHELSNLKHELTNIKLYLNIKNITLPEELLQTN